MINQTPTPEDRGPFKAIVDKEGHLFPRNITVEVCTDTAAKLSRVPYAPFFLVTEADGKITETDAAEALRSGAVCGPGCC